MGMRAKALLAMVVIAAAVVGCGDDDNGSNVGDGGSSSAAKQEFVSEANAYCKRWRVELAKEFQNYAVAYRERNPDELEAEATFRAGFWKLGIPSIEGMLAELKTLDPPADDELEAYFEEFETALARLETKQGIREARVLDELEQARQLALDYGIRFCVVGAA